MPFKIRQLFNINQKQILPMLIGCALFNVSNNTFAYNVSENININAFATQSFVYSPDNPFAGEENGSFNFRDFVLNGSWQLNDQVRFSGQVINRTLGQISKSKTNIDFLLADLTLLNKQDYTLGLRLGRVKTPFGFYNSARDIPSTRPGVYVPQSTYFENYRDLLISSDGVHLYYDAFHDLGDFHVQLYRGKRPASEEEFEQYAPGFDGSGDYRNSGLSITFAPNIESDLTFNISVLDSKSSIDGVVPYAGPPSFTPQSLNTTVKFDGLFKLIGVQYQVNDWLFTSEFVSVDSYSTLDTDLGRFVDSNITSQGFYLQAEWFADARYSLMTRFDTFYTDTADKDGEASQSGTNPAYNFYGKGITLGARWFINRNLSLTTEISKNRGTTWIQTEPEYDLNDLKKDWNVFSAQLNYQF